MCSEGRLNYYNILKKMIGSKINMTIDYNRIEKLAYMKHMSITVYVSNKNIHRYRYWQYAIAVHSEEGA
jgi:hypothetical protein